MNSVAVFNGDFQFINFVTWQKALTLIHKGKAEVLKPSDKIVNTINATFVLPLAIRLIKIVRMVYKAKVPFSKRGVFIRDDFTCQYCKKHVKKPTIDHVIPQSKGGPNTWENCVTACKDCNIKKKDFLCSEIKMYPIKKPTAPTIGEFLRKKFVSLGLTDLIADIFS